MARPTRFTTITLLATLAAFGEAPRVTLLPSVYPPAPLGTKVVWTAMIDGIGDANLWYRFRSRAVGGNFETIRDFGPESVLEWTAAGTEGVYEMQVTVRNLGTGESSTVSELFQMTSRVTGNMPVVNTTPHQLVFLYSAPPCAPPGRMKVQFQAADGIATSTPYKDCLPDSSMNFYLAGMRAATAYTARHYVDTGAGLVEGPAVGFETPEVPLKLAGYQVQTPRPAAGSAGVLLQSTLAQMTVATDLAGNLIWYYPGAVTSLTRPLGDGRFMGIFQFPALERSLEYVREFDLAGFTVRETNAARVSEQLEARGMQPITAFHHEARRLPDGKILVLASTERILTDVQGAGEVNVIGDDIIVLNDDLDVVWAWDSFDHMDVRRLATLNETCTPVGGGCPPFHLTPIANDWLHGNSVQQTPDGDLLYSARHQDWLIKIDYKRGEGTGKVIWRLGKDGDFRFISKDPYPWFSHQHDGAFSPSGVLTVFDNGNMRYDADNTAHSRGQAWLIDEVNLTATEVLNADLGEYAFALGSACQLPDGGYHFNLGLLAGRRVSRAIEVDSAGKPVFAIDALTPMYRSFRVADLYSATAY